MAAAGRLQQKVACSHNAYHSQTERDIDKNQEESEREHHFHEHSQHCGGSWSMYALFIYKKRLLTAISFHVPVPRVCVLTGEMSPRHKHVACCELGDEHISELHPRAQRLPLQRPWQVARHTATNPQTDPTIKSHLYNTKHKRLIRNKENRRIKT